MSEPLGLALIFHFNQAIGPYARMANGACYAGLLRVLRRRRRVPVTLHISGTLLHGLAWYAPGTLRLIRDGIRDGQFELLGSTFAQNVMASTDDWSNDIQMRLHREAIQARFGVSPRGFWMPERCWKPEFADTLLRHGYLYTLLEGHMLSAAGVRGVNRPVSTGSGGRLLIFHDDERLRHAVNLAIWSGIRGKVEAHLRSVSRDGGAGGLIAYAEDAESTGLWGYEKGTAPEVAWRNLHGLLGWLSRHPRVRLVTPGAFFSSRGAGRVRLAPRIPEGQATWMARACRDPRAPYHEGGYRDWFHFNRASPKLRKYRAVFQSIGRRLAAVGGRVRGAAARRLHRLALLSFASHQYEFGCLGIGREVSLPFGGARQALVSARAAKLAERPRPGLWSADVNEDGVPEWLLATPQALWIFSPLGGRLIHAYDLRRGRELVGTSLVPREAGDREDDGVYVPSRRYPPPWTPWAWGGVRLDRKTVRIVQAWFRHHLARWGFAGLSGALVEEWRFARPAVASARGGRGWVYHPPQRALNDTVWWNGQRVLSPEENLPYQAARWRGGLRLRIVKGPVALEKCVTADGAGLRVRYRVTPRGGRGGRIALQVISGLTRDPLAVLCAGRGAPPGLSARYTAIRGRAHRSRLPGFLETLDRLTVSAPAGSAAVDIILSS